MTENRRKLNQPATELTTCLTEIRGLDEITNSGLPEGRPTLVCGGAGNGKTQLVTDLLRSSTGEG